MLLPLPTTRYSGGGGADRWWARDMSVGVWGVRVLMDAIVGLSRSEESAWENRSSVRGAPFSGHDTSQATMWLGLMAAKSTCPSREKHKSATSGTPDDSLERPSTVWLRPPGAMVGVVLNRSLSRIFLQHRTLSPDTAAAVSTALLVLSNLPDVASRIRSGKFHSTICSRCNTTSVRETPSGVRGSGHTTRLAGSSRAGMVNE
mmetsp:Transcript_42140/g.119612  ORF Transcript_42140/g.119612 Transcript_42140/m.119612 type:complete len:203 (-) Transcript_42140:436-1044(-)